LVENFDCDRHLHRRTKVWNNWDGVGWMSDYEHSKVSSLLASFSSIQSSVGKEEIVLVPLAALTWYTHGFGRSLETIFLELEIHLLY
jgi:hypothetical protein